MASFNDINEIIQNPFIVKTQKIAMTIGFVIANALNITISMSLIILFTLVIEGGSLVFYLWDRVMTFFKCKSLIIYNQNPNGDIKTQGPRYTIFTMFSTASPIFSIYLENLVVSTKDNYYVTNGWNSYIFVLFGKYTEHTVITDASNVVQEIETDQVNRGSWRYQPKNVYHKITLKKNTNAWVLRVAFKKQHESSCIEILDNKIKTL